MLIVDRGKKFWDERIENKFQSTVLQLLKISGIFFFFFFLFTVVPMAYGSSQARGQITAAAVAYAIVMATLDLSCICSLCHC